MAGLARREPRADRGLPALVAAALAAVGLADRMASGATGLMVRREGPAETLITTRPLAVVRLAATAGMARNSTRHMGVEAGVLDKAQASSARAANMAAVEAVAVEEMAARPAAALAVRGETAGMASKA